MKAISFTPGTSNDFCGSTNASVKIDDVSGAEEFDRGSTGNVTEAAIRNRYRSLTFSSDSFVRVALVRRGRVNED
jgi:hypothetical protein